MKKTNGKTKVFNVIIMDRSGSMWDIQKSAIHGYNEVLGGIKADAEKYADTQEHFVTLVLFDGFSINDVYWNANPQKAAILTTETYVPGASTPLYDAIGRTLTKLEKQLRGDERHSAVVTIITDGLENSSTEYSLSAVQTMIGHLKEEGWVFAYMGTDHDVEGVTATLSVTNVVKFEKTEAETKAAFEKERRARNRLASRIAVYDAIASDATLKERYIFQSQLAASYYAEQEGE